MIYRYIQEIYNSTIRERLPRVVCNCNGVPARACRLLDIHRERPTYEENLLDGLRKLVEDDDDVLILGGGFGVSSVVANRYAEKVTVYEGSKAQIELITDTFQLNEVEGEIDVVCGYVGGEGMLYADDACDVIDPNELPECDLMVVDIEGGECTTLQNISSYPERLVVETHPQYGCSTDSVVEILESYGYEILELRNSTSDHDILFVSRG